TQERAHQAESAVGDSAAVVPITPARFADTRPDQPLGTFDGEAQGTGLVEGGTILTVQIGGRGNVPSDAAAVVANVTAVAPQSAGYLTVFQCGHDRPPTSNVNYVADQTVPNAVVASIGSNGTICVFSLATAHVLVDVNGYVPNGGAVGTITPA